MNSISSKLNSADTYRYTALTFTPRKDGYTDSTYKQLAYYINPGEPESENTIKSFMKRLKQSGIIRIESNNTKDKRRNNYYIPEPVENFRMIKKELLDLKIDIPLKGFMIQLFTICINNTLDMNYSISKFTRMIKISKPTASKYLKELVALQLIEKTDLGYRLDIKYFKIGKESEIEKIKNNIEGCDYLEKEFNKTDWNKINKPLDYWRSIEGGYRGIKKEEITATEITI